MCSEDQVNFSQNVYPSISFPSSAYPYENNGMYNSSFNPLSRGPSFSNSNIDFQPHNSHQVFSGGYQSSYISNEEGNLESTQQKGGGPSKNGVYLPAFYEN